MSDKARLTTTSYAILGLLGFRSWSTYELTQQMTRSLGRFWSRAESKLYIEPKKLVSHGLAEVSEEYVGQRRRSRYSITKEGRHALRNWLGEGSNPPTLEAEHVLKVFLADQAGKADLIATLKDMQLWAEKRMDDDASIAREYLSGSGEFTERTALLILVGKYSSDFALMTRDWARWALKTVQTWPESLETAPPDWKELKTIAERT